MSDDMTSRFGLPLIQPGQAQKELSHNEALALIDLLVGPAVLELGRETPPGDPLPGQAWIIGAAPTGDWTGKAHALAGWTAGGWRFVDPVEGISCWVTESSAFALFSGGNWQLGQLRGESLTLGGLQVVGARHAAIAEPASGTVIDAQARATLNIVLAAMRGHGLIAS